jgi:hypothetical protein
MHRKMIVRVAQRDPFQPVVPSTMRRDAVHGVAAIK